MRRHLMAALCMLLFLSCNNRNDQGCFHVVELHRPQLSVQDVSAIIDKIVDPKLRQQGPNPYLKMQTCSYSYEHRCWMVSFMGAQMKGDHSRYCSAIKDVDFEINDQTKEIKKSAYTETETDKPVEIDEVPMQEWLRPEE